MPELTRPHDRFFKEMFSKKEVVSHHLQNFLPKEVLSYLDLDTLEISKDTFIDPKLTEHYSDMLYKVNTKEGTGVFVYILFEHKSHPEPKIAYQLLRYLLNIWDTLPEPTINKLPVIIPLVFYHGVEKWNISTKFSDLMDIPKPCTKYVPDFYYELNDLSQYSDDEIKVPIINRAMYLLLKHIFSEDIGKWFDYTCILLSQLESEQTALEFLETALKYLSSASEEIDEKTIQQSIKKALPMRGERVMPTLVEKWLEQGREEGREEGIEKGIEKGKIEGLQEAIQIVLKSKFGAEGISLCERVNNIDSVEKLKQIEEKLLQSDSIEEIGFYL